MENTIEVKDGRLIINVALDTQGKRSASGKSVIYYSTGGNITVGDGYKLGINLYK